MGRFKYRAGDEEDRQAAMELAGGDLDGKDFRQAKRAFNKQERINKRAARKARRRGEQLREGYEGYQQRTADEQRAGEYFEDLKKGRNKRIAAGVALTAATIATAGAAGAFAGAGAAGAGGAAAAGGGAAAAGGAAAGTGAAAGGAGAAAAGTGAAAAGGAAATGAAATGATAAGTAATTGTVGTALTTGDKIIKGLQKGNEIYQEAKPLIDAGIQTYQALQPMPGMEVQAPQVDTTDYSAINSPYLNAAYQQAAGLNMGFGQPQGTYTGAPAFIQPPGTPAPAPSYVNQSFYPRYQ